MIWAKQIEYFTKSRIEIAMPPASLEGELSRRSVMARNENPLQTKKP